MKFIKQFVTVLPALILPIVVFTLLNTHTVQDWWVLRQYTPPQAIVDLADRTAMTDKARRIFYVHKPVIEDAATFNNDCSSAESSIVLGCYNGQGIYIYNVEDERLDGVQEVTAAHEMLHAAYDRLSASEQARIDTLTERQFLALTDERIKKVVASYRAKDPAIVPNELHSILGTEVQQLLPELEEYYEQYFTDRQKVVALSQQYERIFTEIREQVERYSSDLKLRRAQIDTLQKSLDERASQLASAQTELSQLLTSEKYREYNARIPGYNNSVESYNNDLQNYRNLIAEYNSLVALHNELTFEQNQLVQNLDSKAVEIESAR